MALCRKGAKFLSLGLIVIITTILLSIIWIHRKNVSAAQSKNDKKIDLPTAVYNATDNEGSIDTAIRRKRNSRYDDPGSPEIANLNPKLETMRFDTEWEFSVPPLPVEQSDVVLIGKVSQAKAYLSNDKTNVYSEFTVNVQKVLKNGSDLSISRGDSLSTARLGGAVRLPDGRIIRAIVTNQNLPQTNSRYVFFLDHNKETQDYTIITAFELSDGQIDPLDDADNFTRFNGKNEKVFLKSLKGSIKNSIKNDKGRVQQ